MGDTELTRYYIFGTVQVRAEYSQFDTICRSVDAALGLPLSDDFKALLLFKTIKRQVHELVNYTRTIFRRKDEQYTEHQSQDQMVERMYSADRIFPLESVEIQRFRKENDALGIEDVTIHTGPYANEFTRSFNALAITIADDIFFRNSVFDTSSEEGRKTLAHELTHIKQYKDGQISGNISLKTLEEEAKTAEDEAATGRVRYFVVPVGRKLLKIKESEIDEFVVKLADEIEESLKRQRDIFGGEKYLKVLIEYESMLHGGLEYELFG
jgi:hypothetical protein